MYKFVCQTILMLPIYLSFTKIIETFWSRDVTDIWELAYYELKIYRFLNWSSL